MPTPLSIPLLHIRIDNDNDELTAISDQWKITICVKERVQLPRVKKIMLGMKNSFTCYSLKEISHTFKENGILMCHFTLDSTPISHTDIDFSKWTRHIIAAPHLTSWSMLEKCREYDIRIEGFETYMAQITSDSFINDLGLEEDMGDSDIKKGPDEPDRFIYFAFEKNDHTREVITPMVRIGCTNWNVIKTFKVLGWLNPRIDMNKRYYYCKCSNIGLFARYVSIFHSDKSQEPHGGWYSINEFEVKDLFNKCLDGF